MDVPQSTLTIEENVDIKPHTTFGVGGFAKYFVEVDKAKDAIEAIHLAKNKKVPHLIIAGGSNLVFNDGTLDFFIIKVKAPKLFSTTGEAIDNIKDYISLSEGEVTCDAGVTLMDLITFSLDHGLSGLEALSGIPGSVGGAIVGNAGAYGQTISGQLESIEIFDGREIQTLSKEECKFKYRDSLIKRKPWVVLSAKFQLEPGDREALQQKSKEIIETRNKKYSPEIKCPGSFFKNILIDDVPSTSLKFLPKDRDYYGKVPAWFFLDQIDAKGMQEGRIKIADFHGNLLMNIGGGTFNDVWNLAQRIKGLVREKFGIELEEEVRYIGIASSGN